MITFTLLFAEQVLASALILFFFFAASTTLIIFTHLSSLLTHLLCSLTQVSEDLRKNDNKKNKNKREIKKQ